MKVKYPKTFDYLDYFKDELVQRSGYKQLFRSRREFYVVGNIHAGAKARYKVAFKDLSDIFQCAVIAPEDDGRPVIPDHSVLYLTSDSEGEAHFLAGLLNSAPARVALYCSSVGVQTQRYFPTDVSRIRLPDFKAADKVHAEVVRLSRECHGLVDASRIQAHDQDPRAVLGRRGLVNAFGANHDQKLHPARLTVGTSERHRSGPWRVGYGFEDGPSTDAARCNSYLIPGRSQYR